MHRAPLDVSVELLVSRHRAGIKLLKPNAKPPTHSQIGRPIQYTVSDMLHMPFSVFFENSAGIIQTLNDRNANFCGFDSTAHAIGKRYYDKFSSQTARFLLKNDQTALTQPSNQLFEERIRYKQQNEAHKTLSIKTPWYNHDNKIIGLFGCVMTIGKDNLAQAITLLARLGLLHQEPNINNLNQDPAIAHLSKQQYVCATYLLQGLSVKQIALKMSLSPRTVEDYISHIRYKLRCDNKTELILKLSKLI
jgi:DNA-binding CsgD family transcriptional regulator